MFFLAVTETDEDGTVFSLEGVTTEKMMSFVSSSCASIMA
jgi:hypothetical protein